MGSSDVWLQRALEEVGTPRARLWTEVESRFLRVLWDLDRSDGADAPRAANKQQRRERFFGKLVKLLLENSSGCMLSGRGSSSGVIFREHQLSTHYPTDGRVEILVESKVVSGPRAEDSRRRNAAVRSSSAELRRRINAPFLRAIDLKAERARREGASQGPAASLESWLRQSQPMCFLFLAVEVVDDRELLKTIQVGSDASKMMDCVSLVAYRRDCEGPGYAGLKVPASLELDRGVSRLASILRDHAEPERTPAVDARGRRSV